MKIIKELAAFIELAASELGGDCCYPGLKEAIAELASRAEAAETESTETLCRWQRMILSHEEMVIYYEIEDRINAALATKEQKHD